MCRNFSEFEYGSDPFEEFFKKIRIDREQAYWSIGSSDIDWIAWSKEEDNYRVFQYQM